MAGDTADRPKPRLIVDCDPGQDDAVAIVVAAAYGELLGITTVGGNAPLADVTRNALLTCQLFGLDVPVYAGEATPLKAEPLHAPEIHGTSGFAGPSLPELDREPEHPHAVEYLIERVRADEGLWLVQIGPATNVATAFAKAPDLPGRLAGVSFMGGSASGGNRTAAAEFNALADPEALDVVLGSDTEIRMCGLDLTMQLTVDDQLVSDIRDVAAPDGGALGNPGAKVIADLFGHYLERIEALAGHRVGGLHDPCAVLAVTHPELFEMVKRPTGVELRGSLTRGMTVVDRRSRVSEGDTGIPWTDAGQFHPVWHCVSLDVVAARSLVVDALNQVGTKSDR